MDPEDYQDLEIDWAAIVGGDSDILGGMLRDVVKHGRKGRHRMSNKEQKTRLAKLYGEDVSELPFPIALKALQGTTPAKEFAKKIDVDKYELGDLLEGYKTPPLEELARIAEALGKSESYFQEYRTHLVLLSIGSFLSRHPETLNAWFMKARSNDL